jgi:hypothetical protein
MADVEGAWSKTETAHRAVWNKEIAPRRAAVPGNAAGTPFTLARPFAEEEERKAYCSDECRCGGSFGSIPRPEGVETAKATAEFHNGILGALMPALSCAETIPRRLEVREGD